MSQGVSIIDVMIVPIIKSWHIKLNERHLKTRDLLFSSKSKLLLELSLSATDSESG
jgi:hypothetical protein